MISVVGLLVSAVSSVFFYTKVRERHRYLDELIATALRGNETETEDIVLAVSEEIYRRTHRTLAREDLDWFSRLESTSPFNVTAAVALKYNGFGIESHSTLGACGTMSRTLLNALWKLQIPARKLQLLDNERGVGGGHTVVEFYLNDRWSVIAPSEEAYVWRKADGEIATAEEIKNDDEVFSTIHDRYPSFAYRFDNYRHIRWEKLPVGVLKVIKFVLGEERFNNALTPKLYDTPRTLFLGISLSLTGLFGVGTLAARYLKTRPSEAA